MQHTSKHTNHAQGGRTYAGNAHRVQSSESLCNPIPNHVLHINWRAAPTRNCLPQILDQENEFGIRFSRHSAFCRILACLHPWMELRSIQGFQLMVNTPGQQRTVRPGMHPVGCDANITEIVQIFRFTHGQSCSIRKRIYVPIPNTTR